MMRLLLKSTLLFVIDALATRIVEPAFQNNQLPHMQQLSAAGHMQPECVSIFPSITPAALSSIITGHYPNQHGIAGAHFFDPQHKSVAYYGEDFWVILQEGLGNFVRDFLHNLNHDRLSAPTLFERVEASGIPSACLNFFIYKGTTTH